GGGRSAQRRGCRAQVIQGGQRMVREPFDVITITFGPLGVAPLECEDPQLAREVRSRVGDTAGDERGCHGGRETDALEGVALLKFGAGRHGCFETGAELSVRRPHGARCTLWAGCPRIARAGARRRLGDPVGEQPAQGLLAGDQELALVGEVPEEGALGDPGALGDLRHRGGVVPLLGEQVDGRDDESLSCPRLPSSHEAIIGDGTCVPQSCYSDGTIVPSLFRRTSCTSSSPAAPAPAAPPSSPNCSATATPFSRWLARTAPSRPSRAPAPRHCEEGWRTSTSCGPALRSPTAGSA